jgi:transposase
MRRVIAKPPISDLFGLKGRRWLAELELPAEERETVDGCLRQLDFCESEIAAISG